MCCGLKYIAVSPFYLSYSSVRVCLPLRGAPYVLGRPTFLCVPFYAPAQDYDFLYKAGVAAIFGPGTPVAYSAKVVMQLLMQE